MITLLSKFFIKDNQNFSSPAVRLKYGMLCGSVGIGFNVLLFFGKLFAGLLSRSISITADAFNNLGDAGSSIITLVGFKLAGQKPDPGHPFGHGRMEYISGLIVSIAIIIMGFEFAKSSVEKILDPQALEFSFLSASILIASICVKLYMVFYNRNIGGKIESTAMKAISIDSLSDSIATLVVLISMLISKLFSINIDGYSGVLVALFIFYSGIISLKETISPLLGQPPDTKLVEGIEQLVVGHEGIRGLHDLIVHDYGPGRMMISLHAEVPIDSDMVVMHDTIDNIEQQLRDELGCEAVIHLDPIVTDDKATLRLRDAVSDMLTAIDPAISIHDFRMVAGPTHTNVIFDMVVPYKFRIPEDDLKHIVAELVKSIDKNLRTVISIDKSYI